jgi:hypothetical protein
LTVRRAIRLSDLAHPDDLPLLLAIAKGRVTRANGSTAISAPHILDVLESVRSDVARPQRDGLVWMPISGPGPSPPVEPGSAGS